MHVYLLYVRRHIYLCDIRRPECDIWFSVLYFARDILRVIFFLVIFGVVLIFFIKKIPRVCKNLSGILEHEFVVDVAKALVKLFQPSKVCLIICNFVLKFYVKFSG